jgi:transcriptional regulator with XRE-family HTH domain
MPSRRLKKHEIPWQQQARGDRLRRAREDKGYSQRETADHIGVIPLTIKFWESGRTFPQWENLRKLADFYGVSVVYLRTGQSQVHDPNTRVEESNG